MFGSRAVRHLRKKRLRDNAGAVIVEFVVALPFLFIVLFMLIGLGQGLWYYQIVTKGVRDGVRYVTRTPLAEPYLTFAKNVAMTGTPGGSDPAFTFWNDPATIIVTPVPVAHAGEFRDPSPLQTVRMTATVPVDIFVLQYFGFDPQITFTVSDVARHIGE